MALSDADVLVKLKARRDAVLEELAVLDATKAGGIPDASVPHAVQHQAYKKGLYEELNQVRELIAKMEGGFTIVSEATT